MATQPSILVMMKKRLRSSVKQYVTAKDKLDTLTDDVDDDTYFAARDRERLMRGVVRGSAQMYIALANPAQANDKDAINDLEVDYGFPGKRSKPRALASEVGKKFLEEYYAE